MERFDEPKPDLKVREEEMPTLKSERSDYSQPVVSRLATEPAQLALTRADRADVSTPEADSPGWDPVSDWLSLGRPLLWLVLLLSIPWIFFANLIQGPNSAYLERARAFAEAGRAESINNYTEAIRWINQAMATLPPVVNGKPADTAAAGRYVYLYGRLGRLYSNMGDFSSACTYYGRAVEFLPYQSEHIGDPWQHLHYGWALRRDGRYDLAIKQLEQATKVQNFSSKDWSFAWRELAISYLNVGRYEDALVAAKRSIEKSTGDDLFWDKGRSDTISGDAYEALNRHKEAQEMYKTSAESDIDHSSRYSGDYLRGGGVYHEGSADHGVTANKWLQEALTKLRVPDSGIFDESTVLNDLANNAVLINDLERAAGYLEQAKLFDLKKTGKGNNIDFARDLYNLAKVKLAMHNTSAAKADLTHCLEIRKGLLGENNPLTQQAAKLLSTVK